jgi:hypothetical protein
MNTSFISVFSGLIFTQGTAVSRETGHALQCKACKKIVFGTIYAAGIYSFISLFSVYPFTGTT